MPHDAKGRELKVGDHVLIPGVVKFIHQGEEYCNVDVELDYPMPPRTDKSVLSAINTKQLEFICSGKSL